MTYEEKLFTEAAAALRRCDCAVGTQQDGRLPFTISGKASLSMDKNGTVYIGENGNYDVFPLASIPVEQTEEPELTY